MGLDPKMLPELYRKQIDAQQRHQAKITNLDTKLSATKPQPKPIPTLVKSESNETNLLAKTRVLITRFSTRKLDRDNLYSSFKSLLDGLQKAELISGDSEDEIELEVKQELVKMRSEHGVLIEIF